jgi:hypothetical protein
MLFIRPFSENKILLIFNKLVEFKFIGIGFAFQFFSPHKKQLKNLTLTFELKLFISPLPFDWQRRVV